MVEQTNKHTNKQHNKSQVNKEDIRTASIASKLDPILARSLCVVPISLKSPLSRPGRVDEWQSCDDHVIKVITYLLLYDDVFALPVLQ
jgi:hypothetical protein